MYLNYLCLNRPGQSRIKYASHSGSLLVTLPIGNSERLFNNFYTSLYLIVLR